jgi:hypothetical protein
VNPEKYDRAIAAIDTANADDPNEIEVRGLLRPKELAHAELASEWIERLCEAPSQALRLAARAHHLRRWASPRSDYPEGRKGYLVWRQELKERHAAETAEILAACEYDAATIDAVRHIILRKNLSGDEASQSLEDALCLVFFETQLVDLANRTAADKMRDIGIKTLRKMSPKARRLALDLSIPESYVDLLRELIAILDAEDGSA